MIEDGRLLSEGASPDVGSVEVELQVTSLHNHTGTAGKLSSDNWVSGSDKTPWHSETSRIFIKKFLLKVFVRQSSKCDALPACNEITVKTNQFIPWECLSPTMYAGLYKDPRCPNLQANRTHSAPSIDKAGQTVERWDGKLFLGPSEVVINFWK